MIQATLRIVEKKCERCGVIVLTHDRDLQPRCANCEMIHRREVWEHHNDEYAAGNL